MLPQGSSFLQQPSHVIGKKRSHEEAAYNLEPDVSSCTSQNGWTNGEGILLVRPCAVSILEADSPSGIELDDVITEQKGNGLPNGRQLRNHKSQRLLNGSDHASSSKTTSTMASTTANIPESSIDDDVVIDQFTLHLGIGWKQIKDGDQIQAAARGWARFIENNFPLTNVNVLLESKGLQSYLVESAEGFYLFTENLRQGQLVSRHAAGAIQNLQTNPPTFDTKDILTI
ncbi:hypothetical protein TrVFT333_005819 [Trichoderma virens FT-333]|nr:hypothetical protein TrVFT333_005819 [Trichoderma virens FT-333]